MHEAFAPEASQVAPGQSLAVWANSKRRKDHVLAGLRLDKPLATHLYRASEYSRPTALCRPDLRASRLYLPIYQFPYCPAVTLDKPAIMRNGHYRPWKPENSRLERLQHI